MLYTGNLILVQKQQVIHYLKYKYNGNSAYLNLHISGSSDQ